jgi:hypothetical protein
VPKLPEWAVFERSVQRLLHLSSTISSGNKWYDPSDGATKGHPKDHEFPLMADCKATTYNSYSLKKRDLLQWVEKARLEGKRFILPVRFLSSQPKEKNEDFVVLSLDDFA